MAELVRPLEASWRIPVPLLVVVIAAVGLLAGVLYQQSNTTDREICEAVIRDHGHAEGMADAQVDAMVVNGCYWSGLVPYPAG